MNFSKVSFRARGPANPCSNSWRIKPVVTIESPPASAARSASTLGASESPSRRKASDQTLVSTRSVTGASVQLCNQTTRPSDPRMTLNFGTKHIFGAHRPRCDANSAYLMINIS